MTYLANLRLPMIVLWCYFSWFLAMMLFYFEFDPGVWLTSVGISLIIGVAYNLNALSGIQAEKKIDGWIVFRFFFMPLCVSSFAGLIKGQGFFMIFPPRLIENLVGLAFCLIFLLALGLAKALAKHPRES